LPKVSISPESITDPGPDFTTPIFAWGMVESSLAVVGANLPLLRPLLHRIEGTCSWLGLSLSCLQSRSSSSSSTEIGSPEIGTRVKTEEARWEREESIRSYLSFDLPPRREFFPEMSSQVSKREDSTNETGI